MGVHRRPSSRAPCVPCLRATVWSIARGSAQLFTQPNQTKANPLPPFQCLRLTAKILLWGLWRQEHFSLKNFGPPSAGTLGVGGSQPTPSPLLIHTGGGGGGERPKKFVWVKSDFNIRPF